MTDSGFLLLLVTYVTHPGQRGAFIDAIQSAGIDRASQAEEGNLQYAYHLPLEDDGKTLLLVEKWKDRETLENHKLTPHFLALQQLKATYVANVSMILTEIGN